MEKIKNIVVSVELAVAATVLYALTAVDWWPMTKASHLAMASVGLVYAGGEGAAATGVDVMGFYAPWAKAIASFGLNAPSLSVLSGGIAVGLVSWLVSRFLVRIMAVAVAIAFGCSPWVWCASTRVDYKMFYLAFGLLAVVAAVELVVWWVRRRGCRCYGEEMSNLNVGRWLGCRRRGHSAFGYPRNGFAGSRRLCRYLDVVMVIVAVVMVVAGAMSSRRSAGGEVETAAKEFLAKIISEGAAAGKTWCGVKWIVSDGIMDDALVRQIAAKGGGPFVVSAMQSENSAYLKRLEREAKRVYYPDISLGLAARLGVLPFLEELPKVETNLNAIAFARYRRQVPAAGAQPLQWGARTSVAAGATTLQWGARMSVAAAPSPPRTTSPRQQASAAGCEAKARVINQLVDRFAAEVGEGDLGKIRENARNLLAVDRMNPLGNAVMAELSEREGDRRAAKFYYERAMQCENLPEEVKRDYEKMKKSRW